MADSSRASRVPGQVVVTTGHLYALSFISVLMVALSFSVGYKVGLGERAAPSEPLVKALLDEEAQTGRLEALLMRVEQNQPTDHLQFPTRLPGTVASPGAVAGATGVVEGFGKAEIAGKPGVELTTGDAPRSGWAVELATTSVRSEADALLAKLQALGHAAYLLEAVVDGSAEYRVRVGGYGSEAEAGAAASILQGEAGSSSVALVRAP